MCSYYEHYGVDWDQPKILEQIHPLDNWDILLDGKVVGVLRLSVDNDIGYLRDIQVSQNHQNQGIGAAALDQSIKIARRLGANKLQLRVFKISPAYQLYLRNNFTLTSEDEKFYFMEQKIVLKS